MKVCGMMAQDPDKYFSNQIKNNVLAHKLTADEIDGKVTSGTLMKFISSLDTSGTLMGVGNFLKEHNPSIKIIEVQGLNIMKEAIVSKTYDLSIVDEHIIVHTEDEYDVAKRI